MKDRPGSSLRRSFAALLREVLLRSAALNLMRGNAGKALTIAAAINDADLRAQTEDDIC